MVNCPNCGDRMARLVSEFVFECQKCGRRLTDAEVLKPQAPGHRRIIRIPIPQRLVWQFCLEEPKDDPDHMLQFTIANGLPHDASFLGSTFDLNALTVYLFFSHESFDAVPEGEIIPQKVLEVVEKHVVQIPERHMEQILDELDALGWDRNEGHEGLWVLLNKLKHVLGQTLDYVPCKWSDLDGAQKSTERREEGAGEEKTADSSQKEGSEGKPQA